MINPQEEYNRLHDHCQAIARERDQGVRMIDELKDQIGSLTYQIKDLTDELHLAHEAMRRAFPENQQLESDKWRGLATMMSHFDICTSARIECNICAEARLAYVEALSQ